MYLEILICYQRKVVLGDLIISRDFTEADRELCTWKMESSSGKMGDFLLEGQFQWEWLVLPWLPPVLSFLGPPTVTADVPSSLSLSLGSTAADCLHTVG